MSGLSPRSPSSGHPRVEFAADVFTNGVSGGPSVHAGTGPGHDISEPKLIRATSLSVLSSLAPGKRTASQHHQQQTPPAPPSTHRYVFPRSTSSGSLSGSFNTVGTAPSSAVHPAVPPLQLGGILSNRSDGGGLYASSPNLSTVSSHASTAGNSPRLLSSPRGEADRSRLLDLDVRTVCGTGDEGHRDGPSFDAQLSSPCDLAVLNNGSLVIAESGNQCIRRLDPSGTLYTLSGAGTTDFDLVDGPISTAKYGFISGICTSADSIFVADTSNHSLRELNFQRSNVCTLIDGRVQHSHISMEGSFSQIILCEPRGLTADPTVL